MPKRKQDPLGSAAMSQAMREAALTAPGEPSEDHVRIQVKPPNFRVAKFTIKGDSEYVSHRFGEKAIALMQKTQEAGSVAKSKRERPKKDFKAAFESAKHVAREGWCGIPCAAFRNAMISACRTVGFKMTHAKLAVFVQADGFTKDGDPLVRIHGKPVMRIKPARNANGSVDLRARPHFPEGWTASPRFRYDADMLSASDIANLLVRVGAQVGVGEGRPDSKNSNGMGWGTFTVEGAK